MLSLIDGQRALKVYNRYFSQLENTGYVKPDLVRRILVYSFLLEFVDYTHMFFDEDDYNRIAAVLRVLFSDGGCLLPFPVFCTNRVTLGRNEYMGTMKVRKTEDDSGYDDRFTEDDNYRIV